MIIRNVALTLGASLAGLVAAATLGVVFARKVVVPFPDQLTRVIDIDGSSITLERTERTEQSGHFAVRPGEPDDESLTLVGEVLSIDEARRTVTRAILRTSGRSPAAGERVVFDGDVFDGPEEFSESFTEVQVPTSVGDAPAWMIPGDDPDHWVIHVHGIRTTRRTALRSVHAAQLAGATSLVCSFRGDGEAPTTARGVSHLGQTEWVDVDAAIAFAIRSGALSVSLVGWSMGASLALLAAERSTHRDRIAGIVLVSPAVDWAASMAHVARGLGVPAPGLASRLAEMALGSRVLRAAVGLTEPVVLRDLTWSRTARAVVPCLVIHSAGDGRVPLSVTRRFAELNPEWVTVEEFPTSLHAWEYNSAPERFDAVTSTWLAANHALHVASARSSG